MSVTKPVILSSSLAFNAPGKSVAFTAEVKSLLHDVIITCKQKQHNHSHQIGTLLGNYLAGGTTLISHCTWPKTQDYYDRFILGGSEEHHITLMALIWPQQSFSPIHYHQAWCVFGIYQGALTETLYIPEHNSLISQTERIYPQGSSTHDSAEEKYYHKLGNPHETTAISFHIYGVSPNNLHKINCMVDKC